MESLKYILSPSSYKKCWKSKWSISGKIRLSRKHSKFWAAWGYGLPSNSISASQCGLWIYLSSDSRVCLELAKSGPTNKPNHSKIHKCCSPRWCREMQHLDMMWTNMYVWEMEWGMECGWFFGSCTASGYKHGKVFKWEGGSQGKGGDERQS